MNERLIVHLAEIILAVAAAGGIAIILIATWHDMRAIARKVHLRAITSSPSKVDRLSVTILVYAHNSAATIKACLESIVVNKSDNYKVVIADNASTDTTSRIIADNKKDYPSADIDIQTLKQPTDRPSALRAAYSKARKSDLVFILDATERLSSTAIRNVVAHFTLQPQLNAMRIHRRPIDDISIRTLPEYFASLTRNILYKAFSSYSVTSRNIDQSGTIVRSSVFLSDTVVTRLPSTYESTIIFNSPNSSTHRTAPARRRTVLLGQIIALFSCIALMTYFFYTAAVLRSNTLLTLSWVLVSLWLLATIWSDESLAFSRKVALTFTLPFMYFLLYVQLYVSLYRALRRLYASVSVPKPSLKRMHEAILQEAYSTRF